MNVHPLTAAYRALNFVLKDAFIANALSNAAQDGEAQLFLSATLAQTFNKRSSALTGAAITDPALAEPFIAAGAAVAFWSFFATEKGLSPRGYERKEMIKCLVGTIKHKKICFLPLVRRTPMEQRLFVSFVLKQKAPKVQERTMLPPLQRSPTDTGQNTWPAVLSSHRL